MATDARTAIAPFAADDIARHLRELGALLMPASMPGPASASCCRTPRQRARRSGATTCCRRCAAADACCWSRERDGRIVGSVQLDTDTPPNQPHRAEVRKLLVHPDFRRQGLARALMAELERHAQLLGRSLLTLDTRTGDHAEPLYVSLGYSTVGVIPGYCRDTVEDRLDSTTIMYKTL